VALNGPIAAVLLAGGPRDEVCAGFADVPN
jgi:hypothetical protein